MKTWKRVVLVGGTIGLIMGLVVGQARGSQEINDDLYCLSEAIYFEAGNQPFVGKMAVAEVILNRVEHITYPNNICDVVHQGPVRESWKRDGTYYPVRWRCQFTYWCDGKADVPLESDTWEQSLSAAYLMITGNVSVVEGATHYHATYVSPSWAKNLRKLVTIEDHIFYK